MLMIMYCCASSMFTNTNLLPRRCFLEQKIFRTNNPQQHRQVGVGPRQRAPFSAFLPSAAAACSRSSRSSTPSPPSSGLPELERALVAEGGHQVPVRVVGQADDLLVRHLQHLVQLARGHVEAVQHAVLARAVHPLPLRGHCRRREVAAHGLARREGLHHLPLERADVGGAGAGRHEEVVGGPRQRQHRVHRRLDEAAAAGPAALGQGRAEGEQRLGRAGVPHAHRAVRAPGDHPGAVQRVRHAVDK
mmetsp:Transcript_20198/g.34808  ORF Transcript_20198/g.34808 Transcript_20198/m.34808 type:complete len:247 (+) Transcript_20198:172-912(+)